MVNADRPTELSRHIDIQHFAIQEWRQRGDIKLAHIPGVMNPADAQTTPLGWILPCESLAATSVVEHYSIHNAEVMLKVVLYRPAARLCSSQAG
jgi:hypothetical protein